MKCGQQLFEIRATNCSWMIWKTMIRNKSTQNNDEVFVNWGKVLVDEKRHKNLLFRSLKI